MIGPPRSVLPLPDEVHVWWIDLQAVPDGDVVLSPDERARAARFHRERDRLRWIRAHASVRRILAGYLEVPPHDVQFTSPTAPAVPLSAIGVSEGGRGMGGARAKPALRNDPRLRFNLAHAGDRAVLAVAWDREVGIDLEPIDAELDVRRLLTITCSPAETARIEALPVERRIDAFLTLWTVKEAYLKAIGVGLHREPRALEVEWRPGGQAVVRDEHDPAAASRWQVRRLDAGPGWVAALVVDGAARTTRTFAWPYLPDGPC